MDVLLLLVCCIFLDCFSLMCPMLRIGCGKQFYSSWSFLLNLQLLGFPGGAVVENLPANAGDMGSSPGLGRSHMPQSN